MNENLLKKIGALFALAENNPSEQEAGAAMELARSLLQRHNLSVSDIRVADSRVDVSGSSSAPVAKRATAGWKKNLSLYIGDYFDVKCFRRKVYDIRADEHFTNIVYYGIKLNTRAAAAALASLIVQVERLARGYKGKGTAKTDYKNGLVWGLADRLKDLKAIESEACTALTVRSNEIAVQWLKDHNVNLSSGSTGNARYSKHAEAGERDADALQLNPVIDGGAQ